MSSPPSPLILLPTNQTTTCHVRQSRNLAITQRNIDMLTSSASPSCNQRCHYTVACVQPGRQIRDCNTNFDGRPISGARDVHQSHFCLNHNIVSCSIRIWPILPISGDRCVDEFGVDFGDGLVVHAIFFQTAWQVVFNKNIALRCQFMQDLDTRFVLK